MNTVTKVFIVLNMLIAIAAGVAVATMYAYNENYKRRWDLDTANLASDLKRLSDKLLEESYHHTEFKEKFFVSTQKIEDLQGKLAELEQDKKVLEATISTLQTSNSEQTIVIKSQQDQIEKQNEKLRILSKRNSELNNIAQVARAVAFQLNVKLAEVEDDYNNAQAELTRRERTIYEMEEEAKRKDALLALVRTQFPDVYRIITSQAPQGDKVVNAVVAAVRPNPQGQQDLVMLTIGRDDQVREGMEFSIYRTNTYIVKVRAERVMKDMVACRVIPDSWNAKDLPIQPGDFATNRLF